MNSFQFASLSLLSKIKYYLVERPQVDEALCRVGLLKLPEEVM